MIFSIGYERLTPKYLRSVADYLDALVIDVRFVPKSRKKGFGNLQIQALLASRYKWVGDQLGGVHGSNKGPTKAGLDWLVEMNQLESLPENQENLLLLCLEESPADCHRHSLIAVPLLQRGIDVSHIFRDEVVLASDLAKSIKTGKPYPCVDFALTG